MLLQLRRALPLSAQLIGVDGGASEVKVHEVLVAANARGLQLELGARSASRVYPSVPGFEPPAAHSVSDARELAEIGGAEREQGWAWIEATAQCIVRVARERDAKAVLVGIAMPGTKTADGRGIALALNGPRIPDLLDRVEELIASEGVNLLAPITRLQSDGWCCGLGEEFGAGGLFADVNNAYYIGGGTGVAESLKLEGSTVHLEQMGSVFPRAWQIEPIGGGSYETYLSARGINQRYANIRGLGLPLNADFYPEARVGRDQDARNLLERSGRALAELIGSRVKKLLAQPEDDPMLPGPIVLERIVVGQRLAQLIADPRTFECLESTFRARLFTLMRTSGAFDGMYDEMRLELAREPHERVASREGLVVLSRMRAAPAIGAAATALIDWDRAHG